MKAFSFTLVFFLLQTLLSATTYYVSNSGNDNNTGLSLNDAFKTLQHAADQVKTGDTVLVANGTYVGFDLRDVNGTAQAPIVFQTMGDQVLINQSGPIRDDGINVENADYVVIDGFRVVGMTGNGNGIRVVTSDNCVVRNCVCDQNAERGIFTGFTDDILIEYNVCTNSVDEHGIYVSNSSDRPVIRFNECYGNNNIGIHMNGDLSAGGDGIISNAQVYGNILHDNNLAAGLNMDGVESARVFNNLIYNNHNAQGIALFQQDGAIPSRGAKIYHNTIIVPDDGRWGILINDGANVNTQVFNNIIINQHSWRGCITVESTNNFQSDYNLFNDKLSATGDGSAINLSAWQQLGLDEHSNNAFDLTSIFVDPANQDYHLKDLSPALDMGTSDIPAWVALDLDGMPRPSGPGVDLGAFEQQVTTNTKTISNSPTRLFPNPFSQELFIQASDPATILRIQVIDQNGRIAKSWVGQKNKLVLEGIPPGVYFLEVIRENDVEIHRVVKGK